MIDTHDTHVVKHVKHVTPPTKKLLRSLDDEWFSYIEVKFAERMANVKDTVAYLDGAVSRKSIYTWIERGILRATRIGSHLLIDLDALDDLMANNSTVPSPETIAPPAAKTRAKKRSSGSRKSQIDLW